MVKDLVLFLMSERNSPDFGNALFLTARHLVIIGECEERKFSYASDVHDPLRISHLET